MWRVQRTGSYCVCGVSMRPNRPGGTALARWARMPRLPEPPMQAPLVLVLVRVLTPAPVVVLVATQVAARMARAAGCGGAPSRAGLPKARGRVGRRGSTCRSPHTAAGARPCPWATSLPRRRDTRAGMRWVWVSERAALAAFASSVAGSGRVGARRMGASPTSSRAFSTFEAVAWSPAW